MKKTILLLVSSMLILGVLITGCATPVQGAQIDKVSLPDIDLSDVSLGTGIIWSQQNTGISVSAEGRVSATPDIALLEVGVEVQKENLQEAQQQAAQSMSSLMSVIKSKGIADKDIQTTQYSIYPIRNWDEKRNEEYMVGYRVTNIVQVKIRKIDEAGTIIDAVAAAAGDDVRIRNIAFSIDDPTPYYKEARKKAVEYAMLKASQIADTAGVELGKPIYISESTQYYQPMVSNYAKGMDVMMESAPTVPTDISGGELEVSVNIQMVYGIK
jgi:uncharacterized protein YggE/predicted small secreted protein